VVKLIVGHVHWAGWGNRYRKADFVSIVRFKAYCSFEILRDSLKVNG
jgi:hypothetical protein